MRKMLIAIGAVVVLVAAGWCSWIFIGEARRWLFFNQIVAEKYADAVLRGDFTKTPDDLIDVQISVYSGWVLFSPHADGHRLILAYALGKKPDSLAPEGVARQWCQLNGHWYELVQE